MYGGGPYTSTAGPGQGCPHCGCTCCGTQLASLVDLMPRFMVVSPGWRREILDHIGDLNEMVRRVKLRAPKPELWLREVREVPRRMKRPFPAVRTGPRRPHWHPGRTVTRRRARTLRRLWRNAGRS